MLYCIVCMLRIVTSRDGWDCWELLKRPNIKRIFLIVESNSELCKVLCQYGPLLSLSLSHPPCANIPSDPSRVLRMFHCFFFLLVHNFRNGSRIITNSKLIFPFKFSIYYYFVSIKWGL